MAGGVLLLLGLTGCQWLERLQRKPEPPPRPAAPVVVPPALANTIGTLAYLASTEGQPVRGFGIVIGLGDRGSSDCPTVIRDYLIETMTKEVESWGSLKERKAFSPSELIDSLSTAVVDVTGVVSAGAPAGAAFDIAVEAIPGTATRSLAGGLLLPCELRLADPGGGYEQLLAGTVVARAGGPVFVNPFAAEAAPSATNPRRGLVLSGGHTAEARELRLLLREPSYPAARRLERWINERFGQRPPTAEAMGSGYVALRTPAEYAARPQEFMALVTHLPAIDQPALLEGHLRELTRLALLPGADHENIALVWEAVGRTALPSLQPLYANPSPAVQFAAARAGLRLKDVAALPAMAALAAAPEPEVALAATRELGRSQYPQAAAALVPLLNRPDQEIRLAAYDALLSHRHKAIRTLRYPCALDPMQVNVVLDLVESSGPPLIYVRRTRLPRIAVFGPKTPLVLPLFYAGADDAVTLTAAAEAGDVTLFTKQASRVSRPLRVAPRVADLIGALADLPSADGAGRVRGVGLPYSQVVQILAALCADGTIAARLEIERVDLGQVFGPQRLPERPETDEPAGLPRPESPGPEQPGAPAEPPATQAAAGPGR